MDGYAALIDRIVSFGRKDAEISAIIIFGSCARTENGPDAYSDLDLLIIAGDADAFISSDNWLDKIGKHHVSFAEKTFDGADAKRVMFHGGLDVDFTFFSQSGAIAALKGGEVMPGLLYETPCAVDADLLHAFDKRPPLQYMVRRTVC